MCRYVHTCIFPLVLIDIHACTHSYIHTYTYRHTGTPTHTHTHTHTHTRTRTHTHTQHIHIHIHIHMHVHMYTHKYTYTHTYTHTPFIILGKLYNVVSQKTLMQSMESIAQKIMIPGVTISFEKFGPDPEPIPKEGKFMIF